MKVIILGVVLMIVYLGWVLKGQIELVDLYNFGCLGCQVSFKFRVLLVLLVKFCYVDIFILLKFWHCGNLW